MYRKIDVENGQVLIYQDEYNKRIRLDEFSTSPAEAIRCLSENSSSWTEKIIVKASPDEVPEFLSQGFECEAFISGYFEGTDMYVMVKYLCPARRESKDWIGGQNMIDKILSSHRSPREEIINNIQVADTRDVEDLARLFGSVFPIYPTPLSDPQHILKTMDQGTQYVYIKENGHMLSAASAEINYPLKNAELTDCATVERARGKGHVQQLLLKLEDILTNSGINCCYTIARSHSYGINKAFYNLGYAFGGRLINNCYIYSGLEDMNVWYKYRNNVRK